MVRISPASQAGNMRLVPTIAGERKVLDKLVWLPKALG